MNYLLNNGLVVCWDHVTRELLRDDMIVRVDRELRQCDIYGQDECDHCKTDRKTGKADRN
jgi:hypothetical protein